MPEISTPVSSRVSYRKMGQGPVLALLHGFPESSTLWRDIWNRLSGSYTLIMPDFPGSGGSTLDRDTSIVQMAQCVKHILDHEGIDKAVLAGHSMGGYVACSFADQFPATIIGLSLVHSTPAADDEDRKNVRRKAIDIIRKGGKKAFINQMVANLFAADFKQAEPSVVQMQAEQGAALEDSSLINYYQAMIDREDRSETLYKAAFPVQWIAGTEDSVIPPKKILEKCYKSDVNFVSLYSNCAHMSMFESPDKLVADLEVFTGYSHNCYDRIE